MFRVTPSRKIADRGLFCSRRCYRNFTGETSIEKKVRLVLEKYEVEFVQEHPIGPFLYDFYVPSKQLLIECDGDYWHSKPKIKERDERKNTKAAESDLKLIRFTESEIKQPEFGFKLTTLLR